MQPTRRILIAVLLAVGTLLAVPTTAQARDGWTGWSYRADAHHNGPRNASLYPGVWRSPYTFGKSTHGCTNRQGWCGGSFTQPDSSRWHERPRL